MISVVYQPYNDTDTSLYTPSQVFVPPAETTTQLLCFCLLSNMWKLQKKKTLRMKQKPVLWLTAGNRGLEKKHINSQMRLLNRMIIVHSQLEDNGAMIWNDV